MGEDIISRIEKIENELTRIRDDADILSVLRRYARGLDRHDVDILETVFWPDAQVNYGKFSGERDEFIPWANFVHERATVRHEHHMTTHSVVYHGIQASVETYVIFFLRELGEETTIIGGARYLDLFEKRDGEWGILAREFVPDIQIRANSTYSGQYEEMFSSYTGGGTWDKDDPSYRIPYSKRNDYSGLKMGKK